MFLEKLFYWAWMLRYTDHALSLSSQSQVLGGISSTGVVKTVISGLLGLSMVTALVRCVLLHTACLNVSCHPHDRTIAHILA